MYSSLSSRVLKHVFSDLFYLKTSVSRYYVSFDIYSLKIKYVSRQLFLDLKFLEIYYVFGYNMSLDLVCLQILV